MTGLEFEIEVGTSFAASIEAMGANQAQVGFLNTFSVLLAQEKYDIVPVLVNTRRYNTNDVDPDAGMAGEMQPFYKGQFITQADSGITELADLKGKSFCFVDPNSTSGYIIPRIIMQANGVDPDLDLTNQVNAGSHNNVAIAVYQGDCDAGVTFIDVLTDEAANLQGTYPDIAEKVVPFAVTERIPNDGVQVTQDFPEELKTAVVDGLLAMAEDPGGAAVLRALYSINGFVEVEPDFYADFAQVLVDAGVNPEELVK
jgi:phosphonate transport system substrate-binding protein